MKDSQQIRLQPGKILDTLSAMQNSLTRVSQRIADYILRTPSQVTQLSIAQLAQATQSGEATVIRFCRTLGYKGFQDFKLDLAIELPAATQGRPRCSMPKSSTATTCRPLAASCSPPSTASCQRP